jgi:hypothetical protein
MSRAGQYLRVLAAPAGLYRLPASPKTRGLSRVSQSNRKVFGALL